MILARTGPQGWARAAAVAEPKVAGKDVPALLRALSDPDPRVRTIAALELGRKEEAAGPALGALESALKDADPNVREAAARAIEAHGPRAGAAVPALTAAVQTPEQPGTVVRACLYALGAIGKAARPALPAIRTTLSNPSVGWVSEKIIRDIEAATRR